MESLFVSTLPSPLGPLTLVCSETALVRLGFGTRVPNFPGNRVRLVEAPDRAAECMRQLEEYFSGQRTQFTVPLDLRGSKFQQQCWRALLAIPYGETRSYAELARAVGRPRAFRAVGMANHQNPVAIVVPCHRVIASNGTLGGYGGGLPAKQWLLQLEQQHAQPSMRDLELIL